MVAAEPTRQARPLLPNEPRAVTCPHQADLTCQLAGSLGVVAAFLRALRLHADRALAPQSVGRNPAYPYGRCREITLAVMDDLANPPLFALTAEEWSGWRALGEFVRRGGMIRHVWGVLRGAYFQNCLQVGTLYVDVANDTVDITKPPVEILPFDEADMAAIPDYGAFASVAERYWKARFVPNHVMPELAPFFPLVRVAADGSARLSEPVDYLLALTLEQDFRPSANVIAAAPSMAGLAAAVQERFAPLGGYECADDGKQRALAACAALGAQCDADRLSARNAAVAAVLPINRQLAAAGPLPGYA